MKKNVFYLLAGIAITASASIVGCKGGGPNLEALSRLSTSATRLIAENKFDSAKVAIDSLKSIGADAAYVKAMETTIVEKKKAMDATQGSYVYSKSGMVVEIALGVNNKANLSSSLNGQPINGVSSAGTYEIIGDNNIKVTWDKAAFNKSMGDLTYDANEKTLTLSNGTVYKKSEKTAAATTQQTTSAAKSANATASETKPAKPKKYVMFCGQQYEAGTNFRSSLPDDYQERAGYYCLKNYHEGASSVYYSGFNNAGILVTAVGEQTGERHIILFMCNGSLY